METIKTISPRVSVVNNDGDICARIEHGAHFVEEISCSTVEKACEIARVAAWEMAINEWHKKAHETITESVGLYCDACPFRDASGCLSVNCPAYRVLDCINKAPGLIKRTVKALRK